MNCPHDGHRLDETVYEDALIHSCPTCGGEFMGGAALAHIVGRRETTFGREWSTLLADHEPVRGVPAGESERSLTCPFCASQMQSVNYAGDTTGWSVQANPATPGRTGNRYFFSDESGVIRFETSGVAGATGPPID